MTSLWNQSWICAAKWPSLALSQSFPLLALSSRVTGLPEDDASFPCVCFSGERPCSAQLCCSCSSLGVQSADSIWAGPGRTQRCGCAAAWRCALEMSQIIREDVWMCQESPTATTSCPAWSQGWAAPVCPGVLTHTLTAAPAVLTANTFSTQKRWGNRTKHRANQPKMCQRPAPPAPSPCTSCSSGSKWSSESWGFRCCVFGKVPVTHR